MSLKASFETLFKKNLFGHFSGAGRTLAKEEENKCYH